MLTVNAKAKYILRGGDRSVRVANVRDGIVTYCVEGVLSIVPLEKPIDAFLSLVEKVQGAGEP